MYKKIIKKLLLGTDSMQEYLCTSLEHFSEKFNVYMSFQKDNIVEDITESCIFLGYKPLIIGVPVKKDKSCHEVFMTSNKVCLSFHRGIFRGNSVEDEFPIDKKSPARLFLKKVHVRDFGNTSLFILEGVKGKHHFLSSFHQLTNRLFEKFKKKGTDNVRLPGNLYEQVRIAYAIPRIISLISVGKDGLYNMFPTDLHGSINDVFYISSLRYEGEACKQVEKIKKIVILDVSISCFRDAYAMGKNHMQDLKPIEAFKIIAIRSEKFQCLLNPETLSYRELELIDGFDIGIHRLFFYKNINIKVLNKGSGTLSHIHQYCGLWREKEGIKTDYVLR